MKNNFEIRVDHAVILVSCRGQSIETKVSITGLERAKEFKNTWYAYWSDRRKTYIVVGNLPTIDGKRQRTLLTRWLMNEEPDLLVDHINRNTLDNRYENLRYVTNSRNQHNRQNYHKHNKTTGFRGVHQHKKNGNFYAYIYFEKRRIDLGSFDDFETAKNAVLNKRKSLGLEVT